VGFYPTIVVQPGAVAWWGRTPPYKSFMASAVSRMSGVKT
jgi:hypothetical protein